MLKLIATSPKYQGEVIIVYGDDNKLLLLDMQGAALSVNQTGYLTTRMPVLYDTNFQQHFADAPITFIESSYEVGFEEFWKLYNKKVNKARCLPIWDKLSQADQVAAYTGLRRYNAFLASLEWNRTKADPERFLKDKMWLNDWK